MEVYHLISDKPRWGLRTAREKLENILREGLRAGPDGIIYARPYELPLEFEWVSFHVDPNTATVTNQRLQGSDSYEASRMTLSDYLARLDPAHGSNYVEFLRAKPLYLPEVRIAQPCVRADRIIRYSTGKDVHDTTRVSTLTCRRE